MNKRSLHFRVFFLIWLFTAGFSSAHVSAHMTTERYVLDNGLTVLISPMPQSASVSVYGLVKTGSASEDEYLGSGISHFMEHMLFKGTERRGVGEIPREIQSLGGTINASTHFDYTIYTLTLPKEHFDRGVDILSDMLMNARFDPDEIGKERDVVFKEIRLHRDRPRRYLSEKVFETQYTRHPYRLPVIGFEDLLKPLTREDFLSYYKTRYAPNNMVLSIAGHVDIQQALAAARKYFGLFLRRRVKIRNLPAEPDQKAERRCEEFYPTELMHLSVSYQGVDVMDEDMPALDALAMILAEGESSRLYQSLYQSKKLVHTVAAFNFTPMDRGLFEIDITAREDSVEDIVSAIDQEIRALITEGVTQQELDKMISTSLRAYYEGQLRSDRMAWRTAADEAVTGKHDFTEWYYTTALKNLKPEDIRRVAKIYLRTDRRAVVVLKPKKWETPLKAEEPARRSHPVIERVKLDNGLTVLLHQDSSVPMVWIDLVLNGGVYADPPELGGLSNLSSGLWIKGSQNFPYEMLTRLTARKGISLTSFSGRQSFGIRLDLLSRDLDQALELLSDLVLRPAFDPPMFLTEQNRTLTDILKRNDSMSAVADMLVYAYLFKGHSAERTKLGTRQSVKRITHENILDFYHKTVFPSNAVLSVFGDFDRHQILDKLKAYLASWEDRQDQDAASESPIPVEPIRDVTELIHVMDKEQALVAFGFQAQSIYHADRDGLEVLGALLGSPFNGRMFAKIREDKGLAYTLGGGYIPFKDAGALMFFVKTVPEKTALVQQTFESQLKDLSEQNVTEMELDDIKAWLIGRHERSLETNKDLSFLSVLDELYGLGYQYHQDYAGRIRAVTAEDIRRLARKYLQKENMVVLRVLPDAQEPVAQE